ncbi:hypothetical protein CDD81_3599 [Ophiocordyceps australis]|uniref:Uncharacterized protein n=1 Tax=Ophiocordyceps australis TaxID=1399860 RepID=A0A2C5YCH3_9HYPO|nr:hypothetical protein CDD81_3599 [Ophiocordyceps australis]
MNIPAESPQDGHIINFCYEDKDEDPFYYISGGSSLHNSTHSRDRDPRTRYECSGLVDLTGTVWFVKLYEDHGWLYRERSDVNKGVLRGTMRSNSRSWFANFELFKLAST